MAQLKLYRPTQSGAVNQPFGANPAYYAKFLDRFGEPQKGHMGIDFQAAHGTPLYAVCDGVAWYVTDVHGGDGIYIQTDLFDYQAAQAYFWIINWHLCSKDDPQFKPLIPTDGTRVKVKAGQLIGYTDNTGAPFESSGDHLHFGLVPVQANGTPFDAHNGFDGCIDASPYLTNIFAGDIGKVAEVVTAVAAVVPQVAASNLPAQTKLDFFSKVVKFLQSLFK
jgi:murein DD-endopeptidase MepM/ murein hydrolase activator NlpD